MPLTRVTCCEDNRDTLTIDTMLDDCIHLEHRIFQDSNSTIIALDLQGVNVMLKVISDWKEVNGYD